MDTQLRPARPDQAPAPELVAAPRTKRHPVLIGALALGLLVAVGAGAGIASAFDTDAAATGTVSAPADPIAPIEPVAPVTPIEDGTISASAAADYLESAEPGTVAEFCSLLAQLPESAALAAFTEGWDSEWVPGMPDGTSMFYEMSSRC